MDTSRPHEPAVAGSIPALPTNMTTKGRINMELNTSGYGLTLGLTLCAGFVLAFILELFLPPKSRCPRCMTLSRKKKCPRCGL